MKLSSCELVKNEPVRELVSNKFASEIKTFPFPFRFTRTRKAVVSKMEDDIALELERRKADKIREEQNRKRICESSEELRHLKSKLHEAQVRLIW